MRLGKMSLFALEKVLQIYVEGKQNTLPVWTLQKPDVCRAQAQQIRDALGVGEVMVMQSFSGGGALPNQAIDSVGYFLRTDKCQKIANTLRKGVSIDIGSYSKSRDLYRSTHRLEEEVDTLIDVLRDVWLTRTRLIVERVCKGIGLEEFLLSVLHLVQQKAPTCDRVPLCVVWRSMLPC